MLKKIFLLVLAQIWISDCQKTHKIDCLTKGLKISDQDSLRFKDYLIKILQCEQTYQEEKNDQKRSDNCSCNQQYNTFVDKTLSKTLLQQKTQRFIFFEQKQKENQLKEVKWIYDQISRNIIPVTSLFYFVNQTIQTKSVVQQNSNLLQPYFQYLFDLSCYFFYWLLVLISISILAVGLWDFVKEIYSNFLQKIKKGRALRKKKQIINSFWRKFQPKPTQKSEKHSSLCPICLQYSSDIKTGCQHQFHAECLANWAKIKNNCPKCRSQILTVSVVCSNCRAHSKQFLGQQYSCWKKAMKCDVCISST